MKLCRILQVSLLLLKWLCIYPSSLGLHTTFCRYYHILSLLFTFLSCLPACELLWRNFVFLSLCTWYSKEWLFWNLCLPHMCTKCVIFHFCTCWLYRIIKNILWIQRMYLNSDSTGPDLIRNEYDSILVFPSQPFGECMCVYVCVGAGTLSSLCWFLATPC